MNILKTTLLLLIPVCSYAQKLPTKQELEVVQGVKDEDFNITNIIKSPLDFDQSKLNVLQIDSVISGIIKSQADKTLFELEVPINAKKIAYLGKIHPAATKIFYSDYNYFRDNDRSLRGDSAHIYKYENLYISTKENKLLDRYLVYYTIRAYLIIQYRLSAINEILFNKTSDIPTEFLKVNSNVTYVNFAKNYFVTYDGINQLPETNTYFGTAYTPAGKSYELYPNTQVIYLNRNTVLNGGSSGNVPIYSSLSQPSDKFHKYMRDGFIHTFIHERLHDWIFEYNHLNETAGFLRNKVQSTGIIAHYYPFEEAVVNNTTNILFELESNQGGLSDDVLSFYRKEFTLIIAAFKTGNSYDTLKKKMEILSPENNHYDKSPLYRSSLDNRIFILDLYNKKNLPR